MIATFLLSLAAISATADRPDLVIADFEGTDYGGWTVEGEAFGNGPAQGTLPNQMPVSGFLGRGLVNSYLRGDGATGSLTSPVFRIERKRINFLIGGGRDPGSAYIQLIVEGKPIVSATGRNTEVLAWDSWDTSGFEGKSARIAIVDQATGGWGHINIDQIVQSDNAPIIPDERADLLAKAEESTRKAAEKVQADPDRPIFHVLPPANWMNDPNGPLYYNGNYHLFYQYNPYGDEWGHMHWGHVRGRDLVRWQRRPIALWPSKIQGEDHVFSGCATLDGRGKPILFYTSIGSRLPEQWAAIPDDDSLDTWTKHPANPILTETLHGPTKVHEWRDPFVFRQGGKTYLVLGGNLNANKGGEAVVNVYEATRDDLTAWTYRGVLFRHPDASVANIECPLFFPVDDRWVLIVSQGKPVDWFVGDLDPATLRFSPTARGKADHGQFYAPNVLMNDPEGRKVLWGWLDGVPPGKGWRHCMTLPRVLSIRPDGTLGQKPLPGLAALRGEKRTAEDRQLTDAPSPLIQLPGESAELALQVDRNGADRVELRLGESLAIAWDGKTLEVGDFRAPMAIDGPLPLRVFVDRSIIEVYAGDRACVSRVIGRGPSEGLAVSAASKGGRAVVRALESWPIGTIWEAP